MRPNRTTLLLVLLAGCLTAGGATSVAAPSSSPADEATAGLLVESVRDGSAAAAAGIKPGDILHEWTGEQAAGVFVSPFDVLAVEREQGPRGLLQLCGRRDNERVDFALQGDDWGIQARPPWPAAVELPYLTGLAAWRDGSWQQAATHWAHLLVTLTERCGQRERAAWLAFRLGIKLTEVGQYADATRWLEQAVAWIDAAGESAGGLSVQLALAEAAIGRNDMVAAATALSRALALLPQESTPCFSRALVTFEQGKLAARQGQLDTADELFGAALDQCRALAADSRLAGRILYSQGTVVWRRGRMDDAEAFFRQSLTMLERVAPGGLDMANSLNGLGAVAWRQGNMTAAETYYRRALEIRQRADPGSRSTAGSLNNLGNVAWNRGDLALAEVYYRQSMEIYRQLAPDSLELAHSLHNLAGVSRRRGHLLDAEGYYRQALAIRQEQSPRSGETAATLNNLGIVALKRGHAALAGEYFRRALDIRREQAPGSLMEAASLNNLGTVAELQGDLPQAESYLVSALEIKRRQAPDSLDLASGLQNLGALAVARGDVDGAAGYYRQALELKERLAPGSLDVATTLNGMGLLELQRGDLTAAEGWLQRALAIRQRLAPGSRELAETLHNLARVSRTAGNLAATREYLTQAVVALETQVGRLGGGNETRQRFSAAFADYYRQLVALQLDQPEQAFLTLERFRGQVLREMMAERDLSFARDLPAELISRQNRLSMALDRLHQSLAGVSPDKEPEKAAELLGQLDELTAEEYTVRTEILRRAPQLAELQDPQPVDLAAFGDRLPAGTLFLSYCAGPEELLILRLLDGRLTVHRVAVTREALHRAVRFFRLLLTNPGYPESWIRRKGQELAGWLLAPVLSPTETAGRILVCPDGPLHFLPFAALPLADGYLVERHPVSRIISATLWAETRPATSPLPDAPRLVAFGDPAPLPAEPGSAATTRPLSLPASRREVERICGLFGDEARSLLGEAAAEAAVRRDGENVALLHFACHGILDESVPLDSRLILAASPDVAGHNGDGLLQAWEILEDVRLHADLVVLSACQSGLGAEAGGEGMVGLTRAFHYAGARSVLASLWSVADDSTAWLMEYLYEGLQQGEPVGDALRTAQVRCLRSPSPESAMAGPALAHPFYWAGFVLSGAWR